MDRILKIAKDWAEAFKEWPIIGAILFFFTGVFMREVTEFADILLTWLRRKLLKRRRIK